MFRIAVFLLVFVIGSDVAIAQNLGELDRFRVERQKSGMLILGSWALLNMAYSPIASRNSVGSTKYFHQMNGYWNTVNLVIAGAGYFGAKSLGADASVSSLLLEQTKMEKILLFNAALDLGYMMGGLYLTERSRRVGKNAERLKGFGRAIILQGGFLFLFDVGMYAWLHQNHLEILNLTDQLSFDASLSGISLTFRL